MESFKVLSIRCKLSTAEAIEHIAKEEDRSLNKFASRILEDYLAQRKKK